MEIKFNTQIDFAARVNSPAAKASRPSDSDTASSALAAFENSRALEAGLDQLPDVRADKVEEARKLIADPAYPPRETLRRIATLLAMEMEREREV